MLYFTTKNKLDALTAFAIAIPVLYGYGFKPNLILDSDSINSTDGNGNTSDHLSDCSGWSRYMLYHSMENGSGTYCYPVIPEGSVDQHDWVAGKTGINLSEPNASDGHLNDGTLRIGFLRPEDTSDNVGHVFLILGGVTYECYGEHGVGQREWGSESWMHTTYLYPIATDQEFSAPGVS